MNQIAKKWVEVLRSGEYPQGQGYLNKNDTFCCLGVACEVYIKEGNDLPTHMVQPGIKAYGSNQGTATMPCKVREAFNIRDSAGRFIINDKLKAKLAPELYNQALNAAKGGDRVYLSDLNDRGMTFTDIATIIEAEPEGLFVNESDS